MMRFSTTVTLLLIALSATPALGQAKCETTDSPADCYEKYLDDPAPLPAAEEIAKTAEKVAQKTTEKVAQKTEGVFDKLVASADSEDQSASSTLRNSVQLLEFLGLVNTGETSANGTLKIDFNRLLPQSFKNVGGQLEGLLNTAPKLYEPLEEALPEEDKAAVLADLESKVKDGTDLTLTFSFDLHTKKVGRGLKAWRQVYAELFSGAINRAMKDVEGPSLAEAAALFAPDDGSEDLDLGTPFQEMAEEKLQADPNFQNLAAEAKKASIDEQAGTMLAAFGEALQIEAQLEKRIDAEVAAINLNDFAKLLNNQPQLYFSSSYRLRDSLVGQDEVRAKLTWEQPMAPNANRLREYARRENKEMAQAFSGYVKELDDQLEASHRFSFSAEYVDISDLTIDLSDSGFSKTFEGSHKLVASAGWGRQIAVDGEGNATSRFDLMISYEDISDPNPDLRVDNRWLASLNFSQKFGQVSVPISIVYSNKSEFLAMQDLDEQISAHVGFKFTAN